MIVEWCPHIPLSNVRVNSKFPPKKLHCLFPLPWQIPDIIKGQKHYHGHRRTCMSLNRSSLANLGTDWMNASKVFATSKERQLIQWLLLTDPRLIKTGKNVEGWCLQGFTGIIITCPLQSPSSLPFLPFHSSLVHLPNAFSIQALYSVNMYSLMSWNYTILEILLNFWTVGHILVFQWSEHPWAVMKMSHCNPVTSLWSTVV